MDAAREKHTQPTQATGESFSPRERETIAQTLTETAVRIASSSDRAKILVYADAAPDAQLDVSEALSDRVIYVTKTSTEAQEQEQRGRRFLSVPNVPLSRTGQIKIAVFLGLSKGLVRRGDLIVFLTGQVGSGHFDSLTVTEVGSEFEMFAPGGETDPLPEHLRAEVIERVIDLASELGNEGREGKPVGALFVVGDADRVLPLTRQLVINPFRGYSEAERNILDPAFEETVKEFASIDGAFMVRGDGVVETCGAYIKTASQDEYELPRGLGARHHAAAAITSLTDALAVTVSESTGTVTVFRRGCVITEIEKPRSTKPR